MRTGKKIEKNVDLELIARRTPGFTGADLANIINEAALLAARRDKKEITLSEIEESVERVMQVRNESPESCLKKRKKLWRITKLGHALVAVNVEESGPSS